MLNSKQRAALRGAAHSLEPVFLVGRELIKLKVLETSSYTPREAADALCEATGADCVQVIGRKFVLFKRKPKESAYAALLG